MKECKEKIVELKGIIVNGLRIIVDFVYIGEFKLNMLNVEDVLFVVIYL